MAKQSFADWRANAETYASTCFGLRRGQNLFNYLSLTRKDLSALVVGDALYDPFYRDENISNFYRAIEEAW